MPQGRDVVITGLGAVTPLGVGTEALWNALCEGRSGIGKLDHVRGPIGPESVGGLIPDFDAKAYVRPRKALKVMCRELQTSFAASQMAFEQSGFDQYLEQHASFDRSRIGTVFGSEMLYGSPNELSDTIRGIAESNGVADVVGFGSAAMKQIFPLWMLKYLPNMAACHVGIAVQAFGPNNTIILGDTSGPAALIESASCIERGIADLMLAGATGTRVNESGLIYPGARPLGSPREELADSSIPYDPACDGVIGGEGAATLVIESAELARQRKAQVIAKLAGSAVRFVRPETAGARGSHRAITLAIEAALGKAGCSGEDIGLVVAHGTGDPQQDAAEVRALSEALPDVPVSAPIAGTAHCGAASGTIHLAIAALSLQHGKIPPTRHASRLPDDFPLSVSAAVRPLRQPNVLCITHTPQGHATAVLLSR